jgi:hypothetical protein
VLTSSPTLTPQCFPEWPLPIRPQERMRQ